MKSIMNYVNGKFEEGDGKEKYEVFSIVILYGVSESVQENLDICISVYG